MDKTTHSDSPETKQYTEVSAAIQSAEVQASWQFDDAFKADSILLDSDKHVASRITSDGHNPCVMASEPLTRQKDCFRVKVNKVGRCVGIGIADRKLLLDKGKVLGGQTNCINAAYFTQSETIRKLHSSDKFITQAELIRAGDVIDTKIDFSNHKIHFWLNNKPQGSINIEVEEGTVYPVVTLSQFTEVTILALDHISEGLDLETRLQQMLELSSLPSTARGSWQWSCNRKSPAINVIDRDCRIAVRTEDGYNPCILTSEPFSKSKSHFRVQVTKLSNYIGIGVTDGNRAVIDGGSILGQQNIGGANASYFWNATAPSKIFMFGEEAKFVTPNISEGSVVDVQVDFDSQIVYFWIDDILIGFSRSTRFKLVENYVYPCVNLSNGTQVVLRDESEALLDKSMFQEIPWALPITGNSWEWSTTHKANEVILESKNIISRIGQGHNPSILAVPAFSRTRHFFQIRVHRQGTWFAIGLCDSNFVVNGGTTLGTQKTGFNACYYWRDGSSQLRMNGDTVRHASLISEGDIITIDVDFLKQNAFFYKNRELVGSLDSNQIKDGKVFPCVSMGIGSRFEMVHDKAPVDVANNKSKLLKTEFYKFSILCDGTTIERTWPVTMTIEDCCKDLKQPGLSLYCPDKKLSLQGTLQDYKWKKLNKLELRDDDLPSIESTTSSESFFNIFKKL